MLKGKYVITSSGLPILFSGAMLHSTFRYLNPTSAGEFGIYIGTAIKGKDDSLIVKTFGESISLRLKADPNDAFMINTFLKARY